MSVKGEVKSRIGEKHITNQGYNIEIIECFGAKNCTIQFDSGLKLYKITYRYIKMGKIKNPYHKTVCNVGYLGVGTVKYPLKYHRIWQHMIYRCYDTKCFEKLPTYSNVFVCEEWHNFQNFAEWYDKNHIKGFELDKDILCKECKIYSPETCVFVPAEINTLLISCSSKRGKLPIGVTKENNKFLVRINKYGKRIRIGLFDTENEAFEAYKTAKESHIKEVANKWKDKITTRTYQALITYTVQITD